MSIALVEPTTLHAAIRRGVLRLAALEDAIAAAAAEVMNLPYRAPWSKQRGRAPGGGPCSNSVVVLREAARAVRRRRAVPLPGP